MLPEFRYFSKNFRGKIHNIAKSLFNRNLKTKYSCIIQGKFYEAKNIQF